MNRTQSLIVLLCLSNVVAVCRADSNFDDLLKTFKQSIYEYIGTREDQQQQQQWLKTAANQKLKMAAIVTADKQALEQLKKEIKEFGLQKYDQAVNNKKDIAADDLSYYSILLEVLCQADRTVFCNYAWQVGKSKEFPFQLKNEWFEQVIATRSSIQIKSPETLKEFDPTFIKILNVYIDPENGIKKGDKLLQWKRRFISQLEGYELPGGFLIPAANKAYGFQLAEEVTMDDDLSFLDKMWFMEQLAKDDPKIRLQFLNELRAYIQNPEHLPAMRLELARKLAEYEPVSETLIEQIQQDSKQ